MTYTEHPKCCMAHHFQDKNSCTCNCHLFYSELRVVAFPSDDRCQYPQECGNRIKFKIKDDKNKVIHYTCPIHLAGWLMDQMGIAKSEANK
jgi:hypothetical protein